MCWFARNPIDDRVIQPMIRSHEIALQLATIPNLAGQLNKLAADEKLRRSVERDPDSFIKENGIVLPAGAVVQLHTLEAGAWEIEVKVREGLFMFAYAFNSETGFACLHGPVRPRRRS
jgi:hypothetical protein